MMMTSRWLRARMDGDFCATVPPAWLEVLQRLSENIGRGLLPPEEVSRLSAVRGRLDARRWWDAAEESWLLVRQVSQRVALRLQRQEGPSLQGPPLRRSKQNEHYVLVCSFSLSFFFCSFLNLNFGNAAVYRSFWVARFFLVYAQEREKSRFLQEQIEMNWNQKVFWIDRPGLRKL